MPIHDWTQVKSGIYHNFHQGWTIEIRDALNAGILPPGYYAMADQRVDGPEADVIALELQSAHPRPSRNGGVVVADAPPRMRKHATLSDLARYAVKANRVSIRDDIDNVVAIIEIVSPGNKHSNKAFRDFVDKCTDFLSDGIHLVVVDMFPHTPRDPHGIHHAIWSDLSNDPPEVEDAEKPLTVAAYDAGADLTAYDEPLAVGDALPEARLFLQPGIYVPTPLEATYQRSWSVLPEVIRQRVAPSTRHPD